MEWRARITYSSQATQVEAERLAVEVPGYGIVAVSGDTTGVELTVDAATIQAAATEALERGRAAWTRATNEPPPAEVGLTIADPDAEVDERTCGTKTAAEILGVRPQRVSQLAREHPGFPAAVGRNDAGPVYRVADLEQFAATRSRRPGRRPAGQLFYVDFGPGADLGWLAEPSDITGNGLRFRPAGPPGVAEIDLDAVEWLMAHRAEHEDGYVELVDGRYVMYVAGDAYPLTPAR